MEKITAYLTLFFILASSFVNAELTWATEGGALEDNGYETEFQEILVDAGPFPVHLEPGPSRLLFQTEQGGVYFLQSKNMKRVPIYMELYTMEGQKLTNNEIQGQLVDGVKIKLKAHTIYTLHIHGATVQQFGQTAQIFIAPPDKTIAAPPASTATDSAIVPFRDEAILMARVEADPTEENLQRLAALRAARSRDLLVYAEEHQDSAALDLALCYAESAGQLDPQSTGIKLLLATLYSRAQDLPLATQLAKGQLVEILSHEPQHVQARKLLAELSFSQANFSDAITQFEFLLQNKTPLNGRQLAMLVNSYAASGEVTRGRIFLRQQLQHSGATVNLHLAAALLAHHAHDHSTAMGQLERVIRSPRAKKQYKLYAQELKAIWTGEEKR